MASQPDFRAQLERSRAYEIAMSRWLQSQRGYFILPTYDYAGLANDKAPRLICDNDKLVIPDLLGFHPDLRAAWFEVKVKERADLYRKTNTLETGIASRHLRDYRRVKALTQKDVWIVFIHENERRVIASEIDALVISHVYTGDLMDKGGTTFFVFNRLTHIMDLAELQKFRIVGRNIP